MNLARLRELAKPGQDGSIRPEELQELFGMLPEAIEALDRSYDLLRRAAMKNRVGLKDDIIRFFLRFS